MAGIVSWDPGPNAFPFTWRDISESLGNTELPDNTMALMSTTAGNLVVTFASKPSKKVTIPLLANQIFYGEFYSVRSHSAKTAELTPVVLIGFR